VHSDGDSSQVVDDGRGTNVEGRPGASAVDIDLMVCLPDTPQDECEDS
jgi:hypothetical protein